MKNFIVAAAVLVTTTIPSAAQIGNTNLGGLSGFAGSYNTSIGYGAGYTVTGPNNTFVGFSAGGSSTSGESNTFVGYKAGFANTIGFSNHFTGSESGYSNTAGYQNTFIGGNAGYSNVSGYKNFYVGFQAGYHSNIAIENHFVGYRAGFSNTVGSNNYYSGFQAGYSNSIGSGNLFIGNNAGYYETGSNKLYIDNSNTTNPLILGDFASDLLTVNGKLSIGTNSVLANASLHIKSATISPWSLVSEAAGNRRIVGMNHNGSEGVIAVSYLDGSGWSPLQFLTQNTPRMTIGVDGYVGVGVAATNQFQVLNAYCDGFTWYNVSDRNLKENFARIKNNESVLDKVMELPIQYWNYKGEKGKRHIGPTAQDFHKVFQLGDNEKAISTTDESGVALAAIQELYRKTEALAQVVKEQQEVLSTLLQSKAAESENSLTSSENGLKLHQNQPNPFQRDTKITMEIPHEVSLATLYVYDLQGKTIEKQVVTARGITSVTIEGGRLNSGIYLYTLIGDNKATEVKKMILTE